jgi:hypothetical protein
MAFKVSWRRRWFPGVIVVDAVQTHADDTGF